MKSYIRTLAFLTASLFVSDVALAKMTLSSTDMTHGQFMKKAQEFNGFGCSGGDQSPQLSWSGAPDGTMAYALFAYDPDAPTGSGWWHWQVINIPASVTTLPAGAGKEGSKKMSGKQLSNDYGIVGFGGACPPVGHGAHRYQFTVYALPSMLEIPDGASSALVGFMVNANALDSATLEALYTR